MSAIWVERGCSHLEHLGSRLTPRVGADPYDQARTHSWTELGAAVDGALVFLDRPFELQLSVMLAEYTAHERVGGCVAARGDAGARARGDIRRPADATQPRGLARGGAGD